MSHGLSYGYKKTTATCWTGMGAMLILLIAGTGVGSLLIASDWVAVVKTVGAAYLIYWLVAMARAGGQPNADAPAAASLSWKKRTLAGFFTNATNPKGVVSGRGAAAVHQPENRIDAELGILALTLLSST